MKSIGLFFVWAVVIVFYLAFVLFSEAMYLQRALYTDPAKLADDNARSIVLTLKMIFGALLPIAAASFRYLLSTRPAV